MFRTQYTESIRVITNPGSPEKTIYGSKLDKNGDIVLFVKGKENIYDLIQSNADSVDINIMLKKFVAGDTNALNNKEAMYMDITSMPESRFEAINMINNAKWSFEELPVEIKQKFDNNFEKWLSNAQSTDWFEKMGFLKKPVEVKEEVKEEKING